MNHYDIIILGAGIAGSATAYHLSKTHKVLLLEQHEFLHKFGSSHGGSRIFRYAYEDPRYVTLAQVAEESWKTLEHDADDKLLYLTGGLDIGPKNYHEITRVRKSLEQTNQPFEVLSPKETTQRFPAFRLQDDQIAIHQKNAGILPATRCVNALLRTAAKQGATLQDKEPVEGLKLSNSRVEVKSSKATYSAERLVICAGPWLGKVMKDLSLPLQVEQQQVLYVTVKNGDLHTPNAMPIFINRDPRHDIYGFPLFDHPTAIKISDHSGAEKINVENRHFDLSQQRAEKTLKQAKAFLPNVVEFIHFETCLYTKTPDENFILDLHPEYQNVAIAGGFSGHGFKFGPILGEIMAELVLSGKSKHDLSLFGVNRWKGRKGD
jgi:monomeric sarcosine oxidase